VLWINKTKRFLLARLVPENAGNEFAIRVVKGVEGANIAPEAHHKSQNVGADISSLLQMIS
jgi:hypothetical protein